jgi:hypothetical protein
VSRHLTKPGKKTGEGLMGQWEGRKWGVRHEKVKQIGVLRSCLVRCEVVRWCLLRW